MKRSSSAVRSMPARRRVAPPPPATEKTTNCDVYTLLLPIRTFRCRCREDELFQARANWSVQQERVNWSVQQGRVNWSVQQGRANWSVQQAVSNCHGGGYRMLLWFFNWYLKSGVSNIRPAGQIRSVAWLDPARGMILWNKTFFVCLRSLSSYTSITGTYRFQLLATLT